MKFSTCAAVLASFMLATPVLAQPYSPALHRKACGGDAMRLCWHEIPNRSVIIDCLTAKRNQLSPTCGRAFDASIRELEH
jgi:hypothetical protein